MNNYLAFVIGALLTITVLFALCVVNVYVFVPYQEWIAVQEWQADKCYLYNTDASIGVGH